MFDDRTTCVVVVGAQWGDEGKGKARRRAGRAGRFRGPLSGRCQRRAHGRHRRHASSSFDRSRQASCTRASPASSATESCSSRRTSLPSWTSCTSAASTPRAALRLGPGPSGPALPQAARCRQRAEPEAGHHRPRHRAGIRGQVRPPRHPGHRSPPCRVRRPSADRAGRPGQPAAGDDGQQRASLAARITSTLLERLAPRLLPLAADTGPHGAPRHPGGAPGAARGGAGRAARRGPRHLSLRHLLQHHGRWCRGRRRHRADRDQRRARRGEGVHHAGGQRPAADRGREPDRRASASSWVASSGR